MSDQTIQRRIEAMKRQRIASQKVVNLKDYKNLRGSHVGRKNVLVVDDDQMILTALSRVLGTRGYHVVVASDGMGLSRALENSRLHLFILDIHLPWVNGFELCRLIKSHPTYRGLPLILMSAFAEKEDIKRGFDCGCDEYIAKPFDMQHIVETVDAALV
ncbi:MAG: response regulator [Proteobacteria bacterium]|nr:response regulator [Pseudomonadota bacterium]